MNNAPLLILQKIIEYFRQSYTTSDLKEKDLLHIGFGPNCFTQDDLRRLTWDKMLVFRSLNKLWLSRFDQLYPHIAFYNKHISIKQGSEIIGVKRRGYVVINIENFHPNDKNISIEMYTYKDSLIICTVYYYYRNIGLIIKNVSVQNNWIRQNNTGHGRHIDIRGINNEYISKLQKTANILNDINRNILSNLVTPHFRLNPGDNYYFSSALKEDFVRIKSGSRSTFIDPIGNKISNLKEIPSNYMGHIIINPCYTMHRYMRFFTFRLHQFAIISSEKIDPKENMRYGIKEYIAE